MWITSYMETLALNTWTWERQTRSVNDIIVTIVVLVIIYFIFHLIKQYNYIKSSSEVMKTVMTQNTSRQASGIGSILKQCTIFRKCCPKCDKNARKFNLQSFLQEVFFRTKTNLLTKVFSKFHNVQLSIQSAPVGQNEWVQPSLLFCPGPGWPSGSL